MPASQSSVTVGQLAGRVEAAVGAPARAAESELADLAVTPLTPDLDPEAVLLDRPFIIGPAAGKAFRARANPARPISEETGETARRRLARFLDRRGVDPTFRLATLNRFDDPTVAAIAPPPNLRAALLMLSGWDPYETTVAAILDGANPSGRPYSSIDFGQTGMSGAVATLIEEPDGRFRLVIERRHADDPPELLVPVLVHESLHGGGDNSREEEIIANILDTIAYAEVLLIAPEVATTGTELAIFNNATLVALLNSTGRAGPGHLGVSASPLDDVWLGRGLEEIDARSIRDAIAGDGFYDSLGLGGSPGQPALTALLRRFPGSSMLGPEPRFDEAAIDVIDRGVGQVLPPPAVFSLALTLGLDLAAGVTEPFATAPIPTDPTAALLARPFVPTDPAILDRAAAAIPPAPGNTAEIREELRLVLARHAVHESRRAELLAMFDDPSVAAIAPEPPVARRAGLAALGHAVGRGAADSARHSTFP